MIAPVILVTRIEADAIEILRIHHSAQDRPWRDRTAAHAPRSPNQGEGKKGEG